MKPILLSVIVMIVMLSGLASGYVINPESTPVYLPQYGILSCDIARPDILMLEERVPNAGKWYSCGDLSAQAGAAKANFYYTDQCKFEFWIQDSGLRTDSSGRWLSAVDIYACKASFTDSNPVDSNNVVKEGCRKLTWDQNLNNYALLHTADLDINGDGLITSADYSTESKLYVNPADKALLGIIKDAVVNIRVRGNAYYLNDLAGNNFQTQYSAGCDLSQLRTEQGQGTLVDVSLLQTAQKNYNSQIPFAARLNYVWGYVQTLTANIITKNGQSVYVQDAGRYYPIIKTADNDYIVDLQHPVIDNTIKCAPANVFLCNADATLRSQPGSDVTGQDCGILRGVTSQFLVVDSSTVCQFFCNSENKLQKGQCEAIPTCTNGQIYNPQTNKCVDPQKQIIPGNGTGLDSKTILIAAAIIAGAILFGAFSGRRR